MFPKIFGRSEIEHNFLPNVIQTILVDFICAG